MDISQSFDTQPSSSSHPIIFTTTGITKTELECIELPSNYIFSSTLTPNCKFLVTYKALFTEKYIQALIWNIPIVNIRFLYNLTENYRQYEMRPLKGAVFSTSGIAEDIYANFLVLNGGIYEQNCSIFCDFLVCDNEESEKYKFCSKFAIPIIKTSHVFSKNFHLFKKVTKFDAKAIQPKAMFFEKTFFIDPSLPKALFNKLRRIIIDNEGSRISALSSQTDYIVTLEFEKFHDYADKLIYHQYIFDCQENNALLYAEFYRYRPTVNLSVLQNCISVVDKQLENHSRYVSKLKALGSSVKSTLDSRVTHFITDNPNNPILAPFFRKISSSVPKVKDDFLDGPLPFKIVSPDWVDQCIIALRKTKENKYLAGRSSLSFKKRQSIKKDNSIIFQFTGLPAYFKNTIIAKLKKFGIQYIDSDKFENCTHLVMGSLCSSEKFFCSLVTGAWILTPEFIEKFNNEQNFDFSLYEWKPTVEMSTKETKIVNSIKKWRKCAEEGKRPFNRWNVKIYAPEPKYTTLRSLIISGGGKVEAEERITHVFVDKQYDKEVKEQKVMSTDAIFSYLFK